MLDGLINIIKKFNQDDIVIFVLSLITIFSFIMTLNIWSRTKTIKEELEKIKAGKNYNRKRKSYMDRLNLYQDTLLTKQDYSDILINKILIELGKLKRDSKEIFNFYERTVLRLAINNLEKRKPNFEKTIRQLRFFIVRLDIKEELSV